MLKKYLFLSFLFFTNLYSMEDLSDPNEKTALLKYKFKEIRLNNNINSQNIQIKKSLLDLLPRELWLEILSFLDYKENKREFISFWGPNIGLDDLNLKKMVIDIHRSVILNSKNLKNWKKLTNNIGKSWKHRGSKDSLKNYLKTLNKEFKDDLKFISGKFSDKENFNKFINFKMQKLSKDYDFSIDQDISDIFLNDESEILSQKLKLILSFLNIKKILLMYDSKKPLIIKYNIIKYWNPSYFSLWLLILFAGIIFTVVFDYFLWYSAPIIIIWFFIPVIELVLDKIRRTKFKSLMKTDSLVVDLKEIYSEIFEKYFKTNKIDFFQSDKYFLELMGHKFDQDHDILEFEDVDLKSNGKDEDFSIA